MKQDKQIDINKHQLENMGNVVILVSDGKAVLKELPPYGNIEVIVQNGEITRSKTNIISKFE
ncbi:XtrA/YqaO family protein [Vagococcus fluvialis]|uniref:XtrA/YqaO family protein n=1 Tax=Vagococcus fluvialis TaxID=2738 RepID=UPI003B21334B